MTADERAAAESVLILQRDGDEPDSGIDAVEAAGGHVTHRYGSRVVIGRIPAQAARRLTRRRVAKRHTRAIEAPPKRLSAAEELGIAAWNLRRSATWQEAKTDRIGEGAAWDMPPPGAQPPDGPGMTHVEPERRGVAFGGEDMSPYLIGSVAVGLVLVEGPTFDLKFSEEERTKVVAEVQEGLSWLAGREATANVSFAYDVRFVSLDVAPNPQLSGYEPLESHWRNPAMASLGFRADMGGVRDYVAGIRRTLNTRWGYAAFLTKYPVHHFAYALKPRMVMHYANDGWGPDNIDRVFAHETGHIFGCPDEYASSGCRCIIPAGYLGERNGNCESCAAPFVPCLMAANTWAMCAHTPVHLGWRDTDRDGILDPADPVGSPAVNWGALCAAVPWLCQLLGIRSPEPDALAARGIVARPESRDDAVPVDLLRRVLDPEDVERVLDAARSEQEHALLALETKLRNAADEVARLRVEAGGDGSESRVER